MLNADQTLNTRTALFGVAKCFAIPPNREAPVPVQTNSAGLFCMAPEASAMRTCMILPGSVSVDPIPLVPTETHVANLSKKSTTMPEEVLIDVETDRSEIVAHLVQAPIIPLQRGSTRLSFLQTWQPYSTMKKIMGRPD